MEKFVTDSLIPGWLNVTKELENGRTEVFWKTWDDAQQDFLTKLTFISEALAGWLVLLHLAEMLKSHDRFSCCCRDQFNFCSEILTRFCSKVLSGLGGRKGRTRDCFSFFSLVLKSTWPLNPNVPIHHHLPQDLHNSFVFKQNLYMFSHCEQKATLPSIKSNLRVLIVDKSLSLWNRFVL